DCSVNSMNSVLNVAADFSPRFERHRDGLVSIDIGGLERLFLRRSVLDRPERNGARTLASGGGAPRSVWKTIGEELRRDAAARGLAALPSADLAARLGPRGLAWQSLARGDDVRPLVPTLPLERFDASLDLEWPIEGLEPLSFVLTRLLEPLSTRLERRDRGAAVLHVQLRLVSKEIHARRLELPSPMRDVRTLRTLALLDLEAHPAPAAIDRVTITIDPTPA